jgi:hypothetical protein
VPVHAVVVVPRVTRHPLDNGVWDAQVPREVVERVAQAVDRYRLLDVHARSTLRFPPATRRIHSTGTRSLGSLNYRLLRTASHSKDLSGSRGDVEWKS